jgi:hypothetical protein
MRGGMPNTSGLAIDCSDARSVKFTTTSIRLVIQRRSRINVLIRLSTTLSDKLAWTMAAWVGPLHSRRIIHTRENEVGNEVPEIPRTARFCNQPKQNSDLGSNRTLYQSDGKGCLCPSGCIWVFGVYIREERAIEYF